MVQQRLQKILAQAGVASRRKSEEVILSGRVQVNSKVVRELGVKADPNIDQILLDGKPLKLPSKFQYVAFHKPLNVLVSRSDPHHSQTIYDFIPKRFHHLNPVGRLDQNSSGLLLLTNDGQLINHLLHPRYKVKKEYRVTVIGEMDNQKLKRLKQGIPLDEGTTQPAKIHMEKQSKNKTTFKMTISEGKKRQIRRMCQYCNLKVVELHRVTFGPVSLRNLKPGEVKLLDIKMIRRLRAGLPGK